MCHPANSTTARIEPPRPPTPQPSPKCPGEQQHGTRCRCGTVQAEPTCSCWLNQAACRTLPGFLYRGHRAVSGNGGNLNKCDGAGPRHPKERMRECKSSKRFQPQVSSASRYMPVCIKTHIRSPLPVFLPVSWYPSQSHHQQSHAVPTPWGWPGGPVHG